MVSQSWIKTLGGTLSWHSGRAGLALDHETFKYKSFIYAKGLGLVWWIKRKVNRNKIETDAFIQRSIFILIWWSDVALLNFNLNNLCRPRLINQSTVLNLSFSKKILNLFMFLHCGSNVTRPCLNILTLIVADWKRISQNIRHINTR